MLGPRLGKKMKPLQNKLEELTQEDIRVFEKNRSLELKIDGEPLTFSDEDLSVVSEDIPGWSISSSGKVTVALDVTITDTLKNEGLARELINRIQNMRKENDFDVTDHIEIQVEKQDKLNKAINEFKLYICTETLAEKLYLLEEMASGKGEQQIINGIKTKIDIKKV